MRQFALLVCIAHLACVSEGIRIGGSKQSSEDTEEPPAVKLGRQAVGGTANVNGKGAAAARQSPEAESSDMESGDVAKGALLIVGSLNVDLICEVERLPVRGENIDARNPNITTALGGKGANQAIAAARVAEGTGLRTQFVCQFGDDAHAPWLESVLADNGVVLDGCGRREACSSGTGLVMLEAEGSVAAVVVGGSNAAWTRAQAEALLPRVRVASALLLQREIPEEVNEILAAAAHAAGVPVIQDVGGADRPMSDAHLSHVSYVCPNESELARLTGMPTASFEACVAAAKALQSRGAAAVLVTLGERGSFLLTPEGEVIEQGTCPVPGGRMIDETGAGDAFRAAFAVALVEGRSPADSLRLAAAAGALAVSVKGAEPSLPSRTDVETLASSGQCEANVKAMPPTPAKPPAPATGAAAAADGKAAASKRPPAVHGPRDGFPLQFASRLNSMKDRLDLWDGANDVLGWVARMGTVKGMGLVDFNYPQHLGGHSADEVREALQAANLKAGAICLRYEKEHQAGAFTHPDEALRRKAIEITKEGARWALALGAGELVVWSAFDGYDYNHQVDYHVLWQRVVDAFTEICDEFPTLRVSLEFKPTDENTRFFAVPSTGAALLLAHEINRPNFGLTLDIGHMIMAGENPAQSVALVGKAGKLFGVQLNDGHAKLGAEDGLMFGSVHPSMALEFIRWLQKVGFDGHLYYDTFPRNEDPVREAEYNIRRTKALWEQAKQLTENGELDALLQKHDAMGALELLERMKLP
jgi:ribokinase